ncbi:unnamed protein product [Discula destructiva]
MKLSFAAVVAAVAGVSAWHTYQNANRDAYSMYLATAANQLANRQAPTVDIVSAITTYFPQPTTYSLGDDIYTITAPTTLTITGCPCTIPAPRG